MAPFYAPSPVKTPESVDSSQSSFGWKVVLFNCDCHSFDEVEQQLIKATHCSLSRAREYSWQVHSRGAAAVYAGPKERCEAVASVLEDARLRVKVENQ